MTKLKTVLVEDEGAALRRLEKIAAQNPFLEVIGTAKSGQEAIQKIKQLLPDLILLDIELKDLTAFDVLQQIQTVFSGQIVFLTAFQKYAVAAFNIAATDYLLKPYDQERFDKAILRVIQLQPQTNIHQLLAHWEKITVPSQKINIQEGNKTWYFDPDTIVWIEAKGYYSTIHKIDNRQLLLRKTLKELAGSLPAPFIRVNRSAIINQTYIEMESIHKAQRFYTLKGGIQVKQSLSYPGLK